MLVRATPTIDSREVGQHTEPVCTTFSGSVFQNLSVSQVLSGGSKCLPFRLLLLLGFLFGRCACSEYFRMDVGDHGNSRFDVLSATSRKNPTTRDFYFNHGALKYLAFVDSFADPSVPLGDITKVFAVMMKSNSVAIKFVGRLGNHIQR